MTATKVTGIVVRVVADVVEPVPPMEGHPGCALFRPVQVFAEYRQDGTTAVQIGGRLLEPTLWTSWADVWLTPDRYPEWVADHVEQNRPAL